MTSTSNEGKQRQLGGGKAESPPTRLTFDFDAYLTNLQVRASAEMYSITKFYPDTGCTVTPNVVVTQSNSSCVEAVCSTDEFGETTSITCESDYLASTMAAFGSSDYIVQVIATDNQCKTVENVIGFRVTGSCEKGYEPYYYRAYLFENGSASVEVSFYSDCSISSSSSGSSSGYVPVIADKSTIDNKNCFPIDSKSIYLGGKYFVWYTSSSGDSSGSYSSNDVDNNENSGLGVGAIVGIILGCVVVVLLVIAGGIFIYRRRSHGKQAEQWTASLPSSNAEAGINGQSGLWNDDVITAKRIPRDKVQVKKLLSRGAYGEVYTGRYNRQSVAIKMLIPATRSSMPHVNNFLAEAKMTASMDHPHIIRLVGVAWDSLSDLCVVLEFLDGGDLRTLLSKYETSKHPVGFDKQKATIALHVCHAFTYLHSLMPPVIHRDLKSRNILLSRAMEAKLTDFGISKERLDQTMTAGVGTSLWMAPEVMLGEKYDVKADMFSFGVVLSELDSHILPYTQAKQRSLDSDGRPMVDVTLLQKITSGAISVEFSESSPGTIVELGLACVSIDPGTRPSAAEALYRLQVILSQDLL